MVLACIIAMPKTPFNHVKEREFNDSCIPSLPLCPASALQKVFHSEAIFDFCDLVSNKIPALNTQVIEYPFLSNKFIAASWRWTFI